MMHFLIAVWRFGDFLGKRIYGHAFRKTLPAMCLTRRPARAGMGGIGFAFQLGSAPLHGSPSGNVSMKHRQIAQKVYLVLLLVVATATPIAWAVEPIEVALASGRNYVAWVDSRTDDDGLWLRFENGRSYILREVAWESVLSVRQGERTLDQAQTVAIATEFETKPREFSDNSVLANSLQNPIKRDTITSSDRVQWLTIDAWFGKWTADVGVDGIVIEVAPHLYSGEVVPVRGTLEVELYAFRQNGIQRVRHPQRLGRWSVSVTPEGFTSYGTVLTLPFQAFHPQRDQTIEPRGLVTARLSVPGHGTFAASQADVEVRPYSAFRDRLDIETGRRFLSTE